MRKIFASCLLLGVMLFAGSCSEDQAGAATLPAPKGLQCVAQGETALKFSWEAVERATSYHYQLTDAAGKTLFTRSVAESEVTVDGLTAQTGYRFRVMADGKDGASSAYTDFVAGTTTQPGSGNPIPLTAPVAQAGEVTLNSISATWGAVPNAGSYAYKVVRKGETTTLKDGQTNLTNVTVSGLDENTTYEFFVKAVSASSGNYLDSEFSAALEIKTASKSDPKVELKFPASETDGVVRAFPGAEGAGMYTTGGRGGKVIRVTNLNDSGTGSLRAAIAETGARTIVFDVAGIIELKSTLEVKAGDLTIAGQTAPGDGICLKNHSFVVKANNVIIRYMRFRPGDTTVDDGLDAIWGRYLHNVILDHCSMSWSSDECSSFYTNKNFTMQWCVLTESLHNSKHSKGSHGYGGIWGGAPATFHHNLIANHDSRNPRFDSPNTYKENNSDTNISLADRATDFRNNVVYNFCNYPAYGGEGAKLNFVGNTYKWGPASINGSGLSYDSSGNATPARGYMRPYFYQVDGKYTTGGQTYDEGAAHIYVGDNTNTFDVSALPEGHANAGVGAALTADNKSAFPINQGTLSAKSPDVTWLSSPLPILYGSTPCAVTTHASGDAFDRIVAYVGASRKRDSVDERAASTAKSGTHTAVTTIRGSANGIIDSPADVGGYPAYTATTEELARVTDTDADGIPDYYEELLGLDKANKADAASKTLDPQGLYTNFEVYLHYLVQEIVEGQNAGGTYVKQN